MSTTSSLPTRARLHISAAVIFSARELKQYRRWQRLYATLEPKEHGYVPTAIEYDDFQQWLKRQDSGYFSDIFEDLSNHIHPCDSDSSNSTSQSPVAHLCRHRMHPCASSTPKPRCPVCMIDVHLNYMDVLTRILQGAGGRAPSCTLQASEYQENIYRVWSSEKLASVRQLSKLEQLAEQEAEWSIEHKEKMHEDAKTAKDALELYWSEMGACQETGTPKIKQKRVSFAEETQYSPGRPQEYYWRRSPRYEPGKYTLSKSSEDEATITSRHILCHKDEEDIVSEDSEDYSQVPIPTTREVAEEAQEFRISFQEKEAESRDDESFDEVQDDDGDSDWEDMDSDAENSGIYGDDRDFVFFEDDDACNFVVFAED